MSERMIRIVDVDWLQDVGCAENPIGLLLSSGIPAYIKVRRDREIVYRHHRAPIGQGDDLLPFAGFLEEAAFLPLDDAALAEIAVSRSCHVSSFSGAGFQIPRTYEVTDQTRGGYSIRKPLRIEAADLARFELDRAVIVNKRELERVRATILPMNVPSPEQLAVQIEVGESDLYVTSTDFKALKQRVRQDHEVADYPFDHSERMPGIYWMFQAACLLNDKQLIGKVEVLDWLRTKCVEVFSGKRGGFAAKLVPKELDRAKGRGGGPRPFKIGDLKNWVENPEKFTYPFVGDGLTLVMAVAEWWTERQEEEPNVSRVALARKLYEQNFNQVETNYLVRLIAGVQLSKDEKVLFDDWASEKDRKEALRKPLAERD